MIPYPLIKIKHGGFNECTPDLDIYVQLHVSAVNSIRPNLLIKRAHIIEATKHYFGKGKKFFIGLSGLGHHQTQSLRFQIYYTHPYQIHGFVHIHHQNFYGAVFHSIWYVNINFLIGKITSHKF